MTTRLGHSGPEWRRRRNASGVLMADNTYGVGTLWSPGVFPFVLETALQLLSGLILFSCLCHLESKGRSFLSLPVLAEADLISSAVAMFGNFSFRVLFCD